MFKMYQTNSDSNMNECYDIDNMDLPPPVIASQNHEEIKVTNKFISNTSCKNSHSDVHSTNCL